MKIPARLTIPKTKPFFVLFFLIMSVSLYAQNGINYKALVKDDNGNIVANQSVTTQFRILEGAGQTNVYEETHSTTTDSNGILVLVIGTGTTSDTFSDIDWIVNDHSLNVQIDTGTGLVDLGTTSFQSVPYAKYAENISASLNDLTDSKVVSRSIYIGTGSGSSDNGNDNQNTGLGDDAMKNTVGGEQNVAIGESTLLNNSSGEKNTVVGQSAMRNNTTGNRNTVVGEDALYSNSTGSGNVALGNQAGRFETGSNKLYIENSNSSLPLIWGDFTDGSEKVQINGELEATSKTTVPELQITSGAVDGHVLTSDASGNASWLPASGVATGLEALDEGNGIGWRLKGRQPNNYGDIGEGAIDFSISVAASTTNGATGLYSTALGIQTIASGDASIAIGNTVVASGINAVAMGNSSWAEGAYSNVFGYFNHAMGDYSTAMGVETKAESLAVTAMGSFNVGGGTADDWIGTDPIFEIGNGENSANRNNALTVLKNGKVGLGVHQPSALLHLESDGTSTVPQLELTESSASDGARITFNNAEETTNRWTLYGRARDDTSLSRFNIYHQGTGNIVSVTGSGNVGIGTTNPTEKLQVNGTIKSSELQLTTGAMNGYVLTSDALGNASWEVSSPGSGATPSIIRANLSTIQSVFGDTKLLFDTTLFDTNNEFDTTNNRFVATQSGYFKINAGVFVSNNNSSSPINSMSIKVNGTVYQEFFDFGETVNTFLFIDCIVSLSLGDYVEVYANGNGGNVSNFSQQTFFEIQQIH